MPAGVSRGDLKFFGNVAWGNGSAQGMGIDGKPRFTLSFSFKCNQEFTKEWVDSEANGGSGTPTGVAVEAFTNAKGKKDEKIVFGGGEAFAAQSKDAMTAYCKSGEEGIKDMGGNLMGHVLMELSKKMQNAKAFLQHAQTS